MLARIRKSIEEKDQGFTLIELLVVIIIIGILAAIAIPVFLNQRQKGWDAQAKSDVRNVATAEETYLTESTTGYSSALSDLTTAGFKQTAGVKVGIKGDSTGYCAVAQSQSTKYWWYDSKGGGLLPTSTTAPTAPTGAVACTGSAPGAPTSVS